MKNKLSTIIVDDEAPARNELSFLLGQLNDVEVIAEASNAKQALKVIKEKRPQLIFLDIKLPGISGLEIANQLQQFEFENPIVIFSTAYDEYAVKAFELNAVDYLLKPYQKERLKKAIDKAVSSYEQKKADYKVMQDKLDAVLFQLEEQEDKKQFDKLPVNGERGRVKLLNHQEIIFLSTADGSVYAKAENKEYKLDFNLTEAENLLANKSFLRVHRSYLINLDQVKELIPWFKGQYKVVMSDKEATEISVSRSKVKQIKEIFNL